MSSGLEGGGGRFRYVPDGAVLSKFFWDRDEVSIIQGPVGSGTSTACVMKIFKIACEQKPDRFGRRRNRWMVVRNTYNDLKDTTLKTWKQWLVDIPQGSMGDILYTNPPRHTVTTRLPDGTTVDLEVVFTALDGPEDIKTLLSRELTGVWFNELQFTPKELFDAAHSRAVQGRYPPKMDGGPTWKGVIADMNAPPEGHWVPYIRGDIPVPLEWDDNKRREYTKPEGWNFYIQPPGLIETFKDGKLVGYENNPDAENLKWLEAPYTTLIKLKPKEWIDTYVMNRVGLYQEGRPVHQTFVPEIHVAKEGIDYRPEWPLVVGVDFARYPAAIIGQNIRGRAEIIAEFGMENVSATTFAPQLREFLSSRFPEAMKKGSKVQFWGDPTGDSKGQGTDNTPYQIFSSHGMTVIQAPGGNSISTRLATVDHMLAKMVDGLPALLISPECSVLKTGMAGGYHFSRVRGQNIYSPDPKKNRYADFCDGLQYLLLGMGMGIETLQGSRPPQVGGRRRKRNFSLRNRR